MGNANSKPAGPHDVTDRLVYLRELTAKTKANIKRDEEAEAAERRVGVQTIASTDDHHRRVQRAPQKNPKTKGSDNVGANDTSRNQVAVQRIKEEEEQEEQNQQSPRADSKEPEKGTKQVAVKGGDGQAIKSPVERPPLTSGTSIVRSSTTAARPPPLVPIGRLKKALPQAASSSATRGSAQGPTQAQSKTASSTATGVPTQVSSSATGGSLQTQRVVGRGSISDTAPNGGTTAVKRGAPISSIDMSAIHVDKRPRSDPSAPTSAAPQSLVGSPTPTREHPEWYNKLRPSGKRNPDVTSADTLLQRLSSLIKSCKSNTERNASIEVYLDEIRDVLHKVAFEYVTPQLLRDRSVMHNERGLPQLFEENYSSSVPWPYDIKSDAEELCNKWYAGEFATDLLRGLIVSNAGDRGNDKLAKGYHPKADFYGEGHLKNGQWWPTQLASLRDGAQGLSQGGIYGGRGKGAYSCILSGDETQYNNEDQGDIVWYCGTDDDKKTGTATEATRRMIESKISGAPIRLIRSAKVKSRWAPTQGLRYDGLYEVQEIEYPAPGDKRARHRFRLVRVQGQDPIRGGAGSQSRPTDQEVKAYREDKRFRGFKNAK